MTILTFAQRTIHPYEDNVNIVYNASLYTCRFKGAKRLNVLTFMMHNYNKRSFILTQDKSLNNYTKLLCSLLYSPRHPVTNIMIYIKGY